MRAAAILIQSQVLELTPEKCSVSAVVTAQGDDHDLIAAVAMCMVDDVQTENIVVMALIRYLALMTKQGRETMLEVIGRKADALTGPEFHQLKKYSYVAND